MGCNADRSINYDELISIKYVKGEELPYTGSSIEKYENGHKWLESTYKNDKLNGLWTEWNDNGQKLSEKTFKDGELISEKCWDGDGNERDCN